MSTNVAVPNTVAADQTQTPVTRAQLGDERRRTTNLMLGKSPAARVAALVALLLFAVAWLAPILWAILTSLKSEEDAGAKPLRLWPEHGLTLDAYRAVLSASSLPRWLGTSLLTAVAITVITVVICALAAYALSRLDFQGRGWLLGLTVASIMVPGQILIVPLFREMLAFQMVDTLWGVILPQVIAPINVFILKRFFDGLPKELEEAAVVDGASRMRILRSVILPLSRPILVAVSIFTFITAWNNFLWPFIVINDPNLMTMPVGIATVKSAYGVQFAQTMASAVIAAIPLLVIFMIFQRQIVKGIATTGLAGQ